MNKHDWFWIVCALIALTSWAYTSTEDYNEEIRTNEAYCERVELGTHSDWKGICDG
jgi:hypothetical protein